MRVAVLVAAIAILIPDSAAAQPTWGPLAPPNPYLGPTGTSTMHGDASSSDATPLAGPGSSVVVETLPLGAACPTVLAGSDGLSVALCTSILGQIPTVYLFDRASRSVTAQLPLVKGSAYRLGLRHHRRQRRRPGTSARLPRRQSRTRLQPTRAGDGRTRK